MKIELYNTQYYTIQFINNYTFQIKLFILVLFNFFLLGKVKNAKFPRT